MNGMTDPAATVDAVRDHWVARLAPDWAKPYLRMARLDRPIGWRLLLAPCWWSTALAAVAAGAPWPNPWHLLLFLVGAISMRGAGCVWNDIVDRDIDARVERTRLRPIPSGQVTVLQAAAFMAGLCLIGLAVLLQFNWFTVATGFASVAIVLIYPLMILQTLSTLRPGYPRLAGWLERLPLGNTALNLGETLRRPVAALVIPLAVGLGIYTGVLLSAFSARPFWNTGLLGPLFLISGLSTAGAVALIGARLPCERLFFTRTDIFLISVELVLITLLIINLGTGPAKQLEAVRMVMGGEYTVPFWLWFVLPGLLIPLLLEIFEMRGIGHYSLTASLLVLYGGFMLRYLTVELGQLSTWTHYAIQFDPQLLERLTH